MSRANWKMLCFIVWSYRCSYHSASVHITRTSCISHSIQILKSVKWSNHLSQICIISRLIQAGLWQRCGGVSAASETVIPARRFVNPEMHTPFEQFYISIAIYETWPSTTIGNCTTFIKVFTKRLRIVLVQVSLPIHFKSMHRIKAILLFIIRKEDI